MTSSYRHHPIAITHNDPTFSGSSPSFLCTICWQNQSEHIKPKILGTSARIVCHPCWRAVLDLSICWVCGECIVRGDEVVSLGWCFWHRACFGCLVCGMRMNIENQATWDGKGLGVELEAIPLCEVCNVDMIEEKNEITMEKGLEMVSRFDGGLSRERLGIFEGSSDVTQKFIRRLRGRTRSSEDRWVAEKRASKSRGSSGSTKRSKGVIRSSEDRWVAEKRALKSKSSSVSSKKSRGAIRSSEDRWDSVKDIYAAYLNDSGHVEDLCSLLDHAADMGISEDGTADPLESPDELETPSFQVAQSEDERRDIYVSIFDPFGQPAFKQSKTKPLPKWMQLLPNNVNRYRANRARLGSPKISHYFAQGETRRASNVSEASDTIDEFGPERPAAGSEAIIRSNKRTTTPSMEIPVKSQASITFDSTIQLPGSRITSHRKSREGKSVYMTPPEYPSMISTLHHEKTPFPGHPKRPLQLPRSSDHHFFKNNDPKKIAESCCPLASEVESAPLPPPQQYDFVVGDFVSPGLTGSSPLTPPSSEYLERYQPERVKSRPRTYVAKEPEPILAKIKRQKVGKQNIEKIAGEINKQRAMGGKKVETLHEEEFGLDPRREDLQKELRNLFCEE